MSKPADFIFQRDYFKFDESIIINFTIFWHDKHVLKYIYEYVICEINIFECWINVYEINI